MTTDEHIIFDVRDGIAWLRLNRPDKLNALTTAMASRQLPELCWRCGEDPAIRVLVITGTGRGFCSGADLGERISAVSDHAGTTELQQPLGLFAAHVWSVPKPVIAAVNGVAAGGGMSLALAADFRIAAASARFVPAFLQRGLMPDGGLTHTLPAVVGRVKARRMLMTGEEVDATEALRIGLVDMVVPDADLPTATRRFAEQLAAGPPLALSFTKRALQRQTDFSSQLEFESWGQRMCLNSRDFAEGRRAFAEKRLPVFEGR